MYNYVNVDKYLVRATPPFKYSLMHESMMQILMMHISLMHVSIMQDLMMHVSIYLRCMFEALMHVYCMHFLTWVHA